MADLLRVENLAKRFGGIVATDDLVFSIAERELHAVIGPNGAGKTMAMLRELKKELTILLVEHDLEAVFALAHRLTVLVYGRVIATGKPEDIRGNAQVRDAYLGEQEAAHG